MKHCDCEGTESPSGSSTFSSGRQAAAMIASRSADSSGRFDFASRISSFRPLLFSLSIFGFRLVIHLISC